MVDRMAVSLSVMICLRTASLAVVLSFLVICRICSVLCSMVSSCCLIVS